MRSLLAGFIGLAIGWSVVGSIVGQAGVTVSGLVLGPDGHPEPDLPVQLCEGLETVCRWTNTDAAGRFEFDSPVGSVLLAVFDPLSARRLFYLEGGDGNLSWDDDNLTRIEVGKADASHVEITLPSATELSGLVRRASGDPLAGTHVALCSVRDQSCETQSADDAGAFRFVVPRDDYWLLIDPPGGLGTGVYQADAPGGFSEDLGNPGTLVLRGTPITGLEIITPARFDRNPHLVSGRFLLTDGRSVAGGQLWLCGRECRFVALQPNGAFSAFAAPGPTYIEFRLGGQTVGRYHHGSPGNYSADLDLYTTFNVPGEDATGIEIRRPLKVLVTGQLTQPNQLPIPGATIRVCPWQEAVHPCPSAMTGTDGRFSFEQRSGDHYLQLELVDGRIGWFSAEAEGNFTERRADRQRLELDPSTGVLHLFVTLTPIERELSGRAVRWDGLPDVGLGVTACHSEGRGGCPWVTLTDDEGRFAFGALPSDRYLLLFSGSHREGYLAAGAIGNYTEDRQRATRVDLTRQSVTDLGISRFRVEDDRPHVIRGSLRFADGKPAHDWWVRACQSDCAVGPRLSDGRFAIQVAAGTYRLEVWRDGQGDMGRYVEGSPGNFGDLGKRFSFITVPSDAAREIEIRLPARTWLTIDLQGVPGAYLTTEQILVCRVGLRHVCEQPLAQGGGFERLVLPDDYYITIRFANGASGYYRAGAPGHFTWTRAEQTAFAVADDGPSRLTMTVPARENLQIDVLYANGDPVREPNMWISVCPIEAEHECVGRQFPFEQNGGNGLFVLQRPLGAHYIQIRNSGYALGSGLVSWYVSESEPGGLSRTRTGATTFAVDHVHPETRVVALPDMPRTIPVEIELRPGVNLIGAPAGSVPVSALFAQAEQLVGIILLSRQGVPQQLVSRFDSTAESAEARFKSGRIAWMYVSGQEPITLRWDAFAAASAHWTHRVDLSPAWVVWQSREAGTLDDVARGLTHLSQGAWLLTVEGGMVVSRRSGTVRQGDVIWVESPIPFQPQIRNDVPTQFIYFGSSDPAFRRETERKFQEVIEFFWTEFGLYADWLDVEIHAETDAPEYLLALCGWAHLSVQIACTDGKTMAREYARTLQYRIGGEHASPGWLVEGALEYAAGLYLQHASGADDDPIAEHRSLSARAKARASSTTLLRLEPAAGWWWPSEVSMSTTLSALAVDWLVKHAGGYDAVWTYFRYGFANLIDDSRMIHDWNAAFEAAFGLTLKEFYERFAEYRANGFESDSR